jgi:hypothetical protein
MQFEQLQRRPPLHGDCGSHTRAAARCGPRRAPDPRTLFCDLPEVAGAMGKFILAQMAAVAALEAGLIGERT